MSLIPPKPDHSEWSGFGERVDAQFVIMGLLKCRPKFTWRCLVSPSKMQYYWEWHRTMNMQILALHRWRKPNTTEIN
jgi:hypothetical protein